MNKKVPVVTKMEQIKYVPIQAHLYKIMEMCAKEIGNPGISIGLAVSMNYIHEIAKRAIKIDDKVIIACLYHLGIIDNDNEKEIEAMRKTILSLNKKKKKVKENQKEKQNENHP